MLLGRGHLLKLNTMQLCRQVVPVVPCSAGLLRKLGVVLGVGSGVLDRFVVLVSAFRLCGRLVLCVSTLGGVKWVKLSIILDRSV